MTEKAYRNEAVLRRQYCESEMTVEEIANVHDVAPATIHVWVNRHGLPKRRGQTVNRAAYVTKERGYGAWGARYNGGMDWVYVHRLLAVALYGFDEVADNVVHHKNGVKWDNRHENIEVMSLGEHTSLHHTGGER